MGKNLSVSKLSYNKDKIFSKGSARFTTTYYYWFFFNTIRGASNFNGIQCEGAIIKIRRCSWKKIPITRRLDYIAVMLISTIIYLWPRACLYDPGMSLSRPSEI